MGNLLEKKSDMAKHIHENFQFHGAFPEDESNGLCFNNVYVPEEVLINILSYIDPKSALKYTLVCRRWCNILKSELYWRQMFKIVCNEKPGDFPWYVYYCYLTTDNFTNMIKNGNGAKQFEHWKIINNGGHGIIVENPPIGCDPLPNEPEFAKEKSCFVTSFQNGSMLQVVDIEEKRLLKHILKDFKLPVYASGWTAGRFDCSSVYNLAVRLEGPERDVQPVEHVNNAKQIILEDVDRVKWKKAQLIFTEYPDNLSKIVFIQSGKDKQFWAGHYGSKLTGAVVKFLLPTQCMQDIKPMAEN